MMINPARFGGGGGGGGSPPVPGMFAWYDASDSGSQIVTSGRVAQWNDLSGNNRNLAEPSSNGPAQSTTGGKPCLAFNGTTNQLQRGSYGLSQPCTIFAVTTIPSTGSQRNLISDNTGTPGHISLGVTSTVHFLYGGTVSATAADTWPLGLTQMTYLADDASSKIRKSGVDIASGAIGTGNISSLRVGSSPVGEFWAGSVCEILIYASLLGGSDLTDTENYLKTKWGL